MKTKLTLSVAITAAALFGVGCASTEPAFVKEGLVAYYPFNGNAKDESGNGNDGEVNGTTLGVDRHGSLGAAYNFGDEDHISIGNSITYSNKITVSAWIKTGDSGEWVYIVSGARGGDILMALNNDHLTFGGENNDVVKHDTLSSTSLNDNKWHHTAASYNGVVVKIYVDGILENSNEHSGSFRLSEKKIGGFNAVRKWGLIGSIDDVRIYNRALSDEEVKALYDLEKPKAK